MRLKRMHNSRLIIKDMKGNPGLDIHQYLATLRSNEAERGLKYGDSYRRGGFVCDGLGCE